MSLNLRQQRFVAEYLIDGNGTRAAVAAGYAAGRAMQTAHDLVRNREIALAIAEAEQKSLEPLEITAAMIAARAWEIAQQDRNDRTAALALLAKRHPEFRDHSITINNDNRQLTVEAERLAGVLGIDAREILAEVEGKSG